MLMRYHSRARPSHRRSHRARHTPSPLGGTGRSSCSRRGSDRRKGFLCEKSARSAFIQYVHDCKCTRAYVSIFKHEWKLTRTVALVTEVGGAAVVLPVALERARNALAVVTLEEARTAAVLDRYKRKRFTLISPLMECDAIDNYTCTIMYMYLRQKCSSEKSRQSGQPSHFSDIGIHCFML